MKVLHISAECYPAAKAGGLGDVVGALPKYLNQLGTDTAVLIPGYHTPWLLQQEYETAFEGSVQLGTYSYPFAIRKVKGDPNGFPLFIADIPGKFDRAGVYTDAHGHAYDDELSRIIAFQKAALYWVRSFDKKPDVLHCHDHHTGLIPFFVRYAFEFQSLKNIPTVFTIHNGEYHGAFPWNKIFLLPSFDTSAGGMLDWNNMIVPLASAIKCCWKLTTVSPSYMEELRHHSNGLESLIKSESHKAAGILNGIDQEVWNPKTDPYLAEKLKRSFKKYKIANRKALYERFNIKEGLPIVAFIGRLVKEKGAALLPEAISRFLYDGRQLGFIVLGTGDPNLHRLFAGMTHHFPEYFDAALEYNEGLAHQIYAGADFLIMPSYVEPCGLNQMYAMRYGSIPIVRSVGGLRDTVPDIGMENGRGIRFDYYSADEVHHALTRAEDLSKDYKRMGALQKENTQLNFSWEKSAEAYQEIYNSFF